MLSRNRNTDGLRVAVLLLPAWRRVHLQLQHGARPDCSNDVPRSRRHNHDNHDDDQYYHNLVRDLYVPVRRRDVEFDSDQLHGRLFVRDGNGPVRHQPDWPKPNRSLSPVNLGTSWN